MAFQNTSGLGDMLAEVTTLRAEDYPGMTVALCRYGRVQVLSAST